MLDSHGSISSISRVCCPAVTINGVRLGKAVTRLPSALPNPAAVCRLTSGGRRVACASLSATPMTEASCNASTKLEASATATNSIAYVAGSAREEPAIVSGVVATAVSKQNGRSTGARPAISRTRSSSELPVVSSNRKWYAAGSEDVHGIPETSGGALR